MNLCKDKCVLTDKIRRFFLGFSFTKTFFNTFLCVQLRIYLMSTGMCAVFPHSSSSPRARLSGRNLESLQEASLYLNWKTKDDSFACPNPGECTCIDVSSPFLFSLSFQKVHTRMLFENYERNMNLIEIRVKTGKFPST